MSKEKRPRGCVYCKSKEHKSVDCVSLRNIDQLTLKGAADRWRYLSDNKLC